MGVVHPDCINLGKDNVVWLWRVTPWGLRASGVYHGLRRSLHLLRVSISHASAIPDSRSPLNHGIFYLYRRALLVTGLMFTYGLVITLGIVVHCNTTIRPKSVRYVLVACSVKYVHLIATTLSVTIRCNTTIKSESVHCALMTYRQVFIYCSATTVRIIVRCDTPIRPKFVYV